MGSNCEHLLIDGYNLIHQVAEWKRLLKKDSEGARSQLANWVQHIHDTGEVQTTLVFDGKGPEITVDRPYKERTFSYIYTPSGVTADTVIEQLVAKAKKVSRVVVATDDRMHQQTVLALGAQVMGKKDLESWVESCKFRLRRFLEKQ